MTTTYERLMSLSRHDVAFSYTDRDTMLYALSVGMGRNPLDERELQYVFEKEALRTLPTQVCVVARTVLLHDCGLDRTRMLLGEQSLTMHRPLPAATSLLASTYISEICDKGKDKGSVLYVETKARDASTGDDLFTSVSTVMARGDGGIGGPSRPVRAPHVLPEREPDLTVETQTRPDQALLYRLNGDRNPLHADPELAARVGFKAPILHGMCTYAMACKEILAHVCDYDHTRIGALDARFTAPVYPGELVATDLWIDGGTVSFRCRVGARDTTVLGNGRCLVHGG